MKINRRAFIKETSMAAGVTAILSQLTKQVFTAAKANDIPVGFQSWAVKDMLAKNFSGTLNMMAGMGYKLIELCSPKGYKDIGFGFLVGMKPADIRKTINNAGLQCISCPFWFC